MSSNRSTGNKTSSNATDAPDPSSSEGNTNAKGKKRKFNPFWRSRGFGRGPYNPNLNSETPITLHLETVVEPSPAGEPKEEADVSNRKWRTKFADFCVPAEYPLWLLYFPNLQFEPNLPVLKHIRAFQGFFRTANIDVEKVIQFQAFNISYQVLLEKDEFMNSFPTFDYEILNNPEETLAAAAMAMVLEIDRRVGCLATHPVLHLKALLHHFKPISKFEELDKTSTFQKMVSFRGTVMRVSEPDVLEMWAVYECVKCRNQQMVYQPSGRRTVPISCRKKCRQTKNFNFVSHTKMRVLEQRQEVRVQNPLFSNRDNKGVTFIDCVVTHTNIDKFEPGDDIIVTGIMSATEDKSLMDIVEVKKWILVSSIVNNNYKVGRYRTNFSENDMITIEKIRSQPSPFRLLVHSLCPKIIGHELVKAGLVLSLIGGGGVQSSKRGSIHLLMIGNPGVGKSELLLACTTVAPKSFYSVGSEISSAGLTASVRREQDRYVVDAGALVMADGGVLCIDEIDKKATIYEDLLDAMERQKVSMVKIATHVNLQAKTTVIAAGNPVSDMFDKTKSMMENIRMNDALLSRFDLIFVMTRSPRQYQSDASQTACCELERFLVLREDENLSPLPHFLMQLFVSYARNKVTPTVSEEVANLLEEFYLELRRTTAGSSLDITVRQLDALHRLSIARARCDLATEVTMEHAKEIIELTRMSFYRFLLGDSGTLNASMSSQGAKISQRNKKMKLFSALKQQSARTRQESFTMKELKQLGGSMGIDDMQVHSAVDSLNEHGLLIMRQDRGQMVYKIVNF